MKICFISSLFADSYDKSDKPKPFNKKDNYDYYLFTNLDPEAFNTSWDIINVKDTFKNTGIESNIIKSRYPKFMGWKLIKDLLNKEYDVIFYCDAILNPDCNFDWQKYAIQIQEHSDGIIQKQHPRNSYNECNAIVHHRKDTRERMDKTIAFLKEKKFQHNYPMYENTAFGYDPNNKKLTDTFLDFWNEYSTYNTSHRDQPLWSYFQFKHNIIPLKFCFKGFPINTRINGFGHHTYC
jgi:hypothetical protein